MLQFMGSQRVRDNLVIEHQKRRNEATLKTINTFICSEKVTEVCLSLARALVLRSLSFKSLTDSKNSLGCCEKW